MYVCVCRGGGYGEVGGRERESVCVGGGGGGERERESVCVCVCVCVCVRERLCAECVCVRARTRVCLKMCVRTYVYHNIVRSNKTLLPNDNIKAQGMCRSARYTHIHTIKRKGFVATKENRGIMRVHTNK